MKAAQIIIIALIGILPNVMRAEQTSEPPSLMERGLELFLEGLVQEIEPALEGMQDFVAQMGPALGDILDQVEDWSVYAPPEILPNGDIIIRRKKDPPSPDVEI